MDDYARKIAQNTVDKNVTVIAGAGTGKTSVLIARIMHLLFDLNEDIQSIVAITFTEKAAAEIKERIRGELSKKSDSRAAYILERLEYGYIGTIHSFCLRLIRENPVEAGIDPDMDVIKEGEAGYIISNISDGLMREKLEDNRIYGLARMMGFNKLLEEINATYKKIRDMGYEMGEVRTDNESEAAVMDFLQELDRRYQEYKRENSLADFDDILLIALELLKEHDEILKGYGFKYIMVDEYQDVNYVQDSITGILSKNANLFVVGDKGQAIYGFRGSRPGLIDKRSSESNAVKLCLEENHRSNEGILSLVNEVFSGSGGYQKLLCTVGPGNISPVAHLSVEGEVNLDGRKRREAHGIAAEIKCLVDGGKAIVRDSVNGHFRKPEYKDIAVLLRKKSNLQYYIGGLKENGIPYHVLDRGSLYDYSPVRNLLNLMRYAARGDALYLYGSLKDLAGIDEAAIYNSTRTDKDLEKLIPKWMKEILRGPCEYNIEGLARRAVLECDLFSKAACEDEECLDGLFRFLDLCRYYDSRGYGLEDFLEAVVEYDEQEGVLLVSENEDAVKIMTIHAAKGLEFPVVFLADSSSRIKKDSGRIMFHPEMGVAIEGVSDRYEKIKDGIYKDENDEEQRVLYVALTRAKDFLIIAGDGRDFKDSFYGKLKDHIGSANIMPMAGPVIALADMRQVFSLSADSHKKLKRKYILNATSVSEYMECPRKFYLENIVGLDQDYFISAAEGSGSVRGDAVHRAIELYDGSNSQIINEALDKADMNDEEKNYARRCLENYLKSGYTDGISEYPFVLEVNDYLTLKGRIDRLILNGKDAIVVDFKTNREMDETLKEAYMVQIKIYGLALSHMGYMPRKCIILSLGDGITYETEINDGVLKGTSDYLDSLTKRLDTGISAFPPSEYGCGYCRYHCIKNICNTDK